MRNHRTARVLAVFLAVFLLVAGPLYAQAPANSTQPAVPLPPALQQAVGFAAKGIKDAGGLSTAKEKDQKKLESLQTLADVLGNYRPGFIDYLRSTSKPNKDAAFDATYRNFLKKLADGRVDQQGGGSTTAGAAAGAAARAGIADFITGAMESGALTQSLDNNVLTLRANGEGLFRFLAGQDVLPTCSDCAPSRANNLELSVSLDVSKSNTIEATGTNPVTGAELTTLLTAEKRQVSAVTARYVVINSRNLRSDTYREAWNDWYVKSLPTLRTSGVAVLQSENDLFIPVQKSGFYSKWQTDTETALEGVVTTLGDKAEGLETALSSTFRARLEMLRQEMAREDSDLDKKIGIAAAAYAKYYSLNDQGFALGNIPMLTVELTYSQPSLQPRLMTGRVIFAWSPKSTGSVNRGTVTFNGAVERYTRPQADSTSGTTSLWRDAQFALQFDRPVGGGSAPPMFTLGAYFQYQMAPGIIDIPAGSTAPGTNIPLPADAKQLLAPKGNIGVVHAGLTLRLPNSGIKIPIGVSWSNRTELLTGNEIRGHIGFTFDTDSLALAALPKPGP